MAGERELLSGEDLARIVQRIASSIDEQTAGGDLAIIGIQRGGVEVARHLAESIGKARGVAIDLGYIDIVFYRDDVAIGLPDPRVGPTHVTFDMEGRHVVVVDDVLQTGRTVRAAIEALSDYGRPRRIWFAALVDRGGRELPIAADFVGRKISVARSERIDVRFGDDGGVFARESVA